VTMVGKVLVCMGLLALSCAPSARADMCTSGTLADYIALGAGGCTLGGLTFSDFGFTSTLDTISGGSTVGELAELIKVTPVDNAAGPGFTYTELSGLTTAEGDNASLQSRLSLLVSSSSGSPIIEDQSLSETGIVGPGGGTGDTVAIEDILCLTGQIPLSTCTGAEGSVYDEFYGNQTFTTTFKNPTSNLGVLEEWDWESLFASDVSSSSITDQYSLAPVPEPSSLLILSTVLLGLGATVRRGIFRP
jgi:hypothetical protein